MALHPLFRYDFLYVDEDGFRKHEPVKENNGRTRYTSL